MNRFGVLTALILLLTPASAWAEWREAESRHFVVYGEGSESSLRDFTVKLERFDALLRRQFGIAESADVRKLPIYLVRGSMAVRAMRPELNEGVGGYYWASDRDIHALVARDSGDDLLFHEYAHHFMYQNFPSGYPAWFVEGFAEYFATASVDRSDKATIGYFNERRLATLRREAWLPAGQLLTTRPRELSGRIPRGVFYAQSWLLTHYMLSDGDRRRRLEGYLAAVGRGTPAVEALQANFGLTPEALNEALRVYFNGGMPYAELSTPETPSSIVVETLPPSADDLLLTSVRVLYSQTPEAGRALLAEARRKAAEYPTDRLAQTLLGRVEMVWGDPAAAETALEAALAAAPDDPEALRLLASIRLRAAGEAEDPSEQSRLLGMARGFLARAMHADPTDYRVYMMLARSRAGIEGYPNDNDLETWRLAVAYAPQLMSLRVGAAEAMLAAGRREEAAVLLAPALNDPHGSETAERARALLAQAEEGETGAHP